MRYPLYLITAASILQAGCLRSPAFDEGLVLRHLPLVAASNYQTGMVHVVRDQSCWQRSIEELGFSGSAPEVIEALTLQLEQTLDVDFETEMVVFYTQTGCGVPVDIRRVYRIGNRVWVELTEVHHYLTCMAVLPTHDVVVIPRSDAEVMVLKYNLYEMLLAYMPIPEIFPAIPFDGSCTQTSP